MQSRTPAIVSAILTMSLLMGLAVLSVFFEMIALNGASERQGLTALTVSLICQGIGFILMGLFASWATRLMITRLNWNKILAVVLSVFVGVLLGGVVSFLSILVAIPVAGVR